MVRRANTNNVDTDPTSCSLKSSTGPTHHVRREERPRNGRFQRGCSSGAYRIDEENKFILEECVAGRFVFFSFFVVFCRFAANYQPINSWVLNI